MLASRLIAQHMRITRDARLLGLYSFYKTASFPKNSVMLNQGIHTSQQDRQRHFVYKKYVPPVKMDHDLKNMKLKRPMSPHMTDYAPTLPSGTSIFQRVMGTILSFYFLVLAVGAFLPNGVETYATVIESLKLGRVPGQIVKFLLIYPFCFHYFIGMRFIGFNLVKFLDVKTAYQTAYMALAASVATAFFCAFIAG